MQSFIKRGQSLAQPMHRVLPEVFRPDSYFPSGAEFLAPPQLAFTVRIRFPCFLHAFSHSLVSRSFQTVHLLTGLSRPTAGHSLSMSLYTNFGLRPTPAVTFSPWPAADYLRYLLW